MSVHSRALRLVRRAAGPEHMARVGSYSPAAFARTGPHLLGTQIEDRQAGAVSPLAGGLANKLVRCARRRSTSVASLSASLRVVREMGPPPEALRRLKNSADCCLSFSNLHSLCFVLLSSPPGEQKSPRLPASGLVQQPRTDSQIYHSARSLGPPQLQVSGA